MIPTHLKTEFISAPAFIFDRGLPPTEIAILMLVSLYRKHDVKRSISDIANDLGFQRNYINKLIGILRQKGYIHRRVQHDGGCLFDIDWQEFLVLSQNNLSGRAKRHADANACAKPVEKEAADGENSK